MNHEIILDGIFSLAHLMSSNEPDEEEKKIPKKTNKFNNL